MLAGLLAMECTQPLLCVKVRVARKAHAGERATGVAGHVYAASDDALEGFPSAELAPLGGEQRDAVYCGRVQLNNVCCHPLALLCIQYIPRPLTFLLACPLGKEQLTDVVAGLLKAIFNVLYIADL